MSTTKTILLVEDDRRLASHWRWILEGVGYCVIHVSTVNAAIEVLESTQIDLLLTDILIEDNSGIHADQGGLEIVSYVALNLNPLPGIIVISGAVGKSPFVDRNFERFDSMVALRKPVTDRDLLETVHLTLRARAKASSNTAAMPVTQGQSLIDKSFAGQQDAIELLKATQFRLEQTQFSLDHAPDGVYWVNENAQLVYTNQWNCELLGYSKEELLTKSILDLNPKFPSIEFYRSEILPKITEAGITFESEHLRKDGSLVAVEISARMLSYEGEQLVCAYVRDVSSRKEKEAELVAAKLAAEESEQRFRSLANSASPLIWTTELDSTTSWLNQRWVDYVGKPLESQTGLGWVESIHPDDREQAKSKYLAAFEKQTPVELAYRLRRHDGEYRWFTVNATPRYDHNGKFGGYVGMNVDSHDDRLHLEQLEQSRADLEKSNRMREAVLQLLETSDGVWHWSIGTQICYFAPGFRKLIGFDADDLEGFPNDLAAFEVRIHPEDHAGLWETIHQSIEDGTAFFFEFRLRQKDGKYLWVKARGHASYDDDGKPLHLVGSTYDISDTKDAQFKLEEEGKALARSNADLAQFAYVASHDLQEPLRAVSGFLQLIENKYGDQLDDQGRGYIQKSIDGAGRMNQLINDLLLFSKVTRTDGQFVTVNLSDVVTNATQKLQQPILESNAVIEVEELPTIKGAAPLLDQLFCNLIGNSIKYRSDDDPLIKITHTFESGEWVIRFQDNGIGIAPKYQEQVFELFKRLHHRSEHSGTGIGLAICKRVVERHGGTISIDPESDQGSCFVIRFPCQRVINLRSLRRRTQVETASQPS